MSRRSSRLVSGGYYHSDEESDSNSVTNILYRENPVRVFKKKTGTRKSPSRTPTRANSDGCETPIATDQYDGVSPLPSSSETQPTRRTVTFAPTVAIPSTWSQIPSRCPSVPPEKNPQAGLYSSIGPGLPPAPLHKELSQCAVDSSGYSSSEDPHRKPTTVTTSRIHGNSGPPSVGYTSRIISPFFSLMDSISSTAILVQSKATRLTALANSSFRRNMKKACGPFLLLLILILSIWFLPPLLTSLISRTTVTKTPSQTAPKSRPVIPATPSSHLTAMRPIPVLDPAVVSAAVEAKLQRVTEQLLSEMKERLRLHTRDMDAKLGAVEVDSRLRLEQELAGLGKRLVDYRTESYSAAKGLSLSIQALEAQSAKLSEEWSSVQMRAPSAPCHDASTSPVHKELTPELQHAMEKWFTDRMKEQDAVRLADKGSCSECGRPMADKMADFALETQGASVISTRCSETYRIRSACVTLFGFPLWFPSESPRTVIQGHPVLLPGKCWAFHGVQGTLVIALSHPIRITQVTLDHLPRCNSPTGRIDSAPKDFEVYGMKNESEEGTLLGRFTYNEEGESTQTFELPNPSDVVYQFVELRVLTNWGHVEYTCLYRFRVHGQMSST